MKHIVIAGAGFTGSQLVNALIMDGHAVVICDVHGPEVGHDGRITYIQSDLTDPSSLSEIPLAPDDIVHHLAARQYHSNVPGKSRHRFFNSVNVTGTANLLKVMEEKGCRNLVYFSSDMVYGTPQNLPVSEIHRCEPSGPYGQSKLKAEEICGFYRDKGFKVTIFRPRLIIGPGRLGVLPKLFGLVRRNLPVPLIGDGTNYYQMVSVFDCVSAVQRAVAKGLPNEAYNLGSADPPIVKDLLGNLIKEVGSRSHLIKTPARLTKATLNLLDQVGLPLMYQEQAALADTNFVADISKAKQELGWYPKHNDLQMIRDAYVYFLHRSQNQTAG